MPFNVFARFPLPTIALAVSTVLTGCGGGGGSSDQDASAVEASVTSTAPGASTSSTTTTSTPTSSTSTSTASTGSDATSTSTSTSTDTSAQSGDTTTVASAGSTDTTPLTLGGGVSIVSTASNHSGVGINLSSITSYSPEMPTVDLMKKASPWLTQCQPGATCANFAVGASGYDTLEEAKLNLDAGGWVKSLPAASDTTTKYRWVATKIAEAGVQQAGNYTVLYDGSGTIAYSGAAKKVASLSTPGRDVVTVENTDQNPFFLYIQATNSANYVRNIRVYPPGGACANAMSTYVTSSTACTTQTGTFVPFESFPTTTTFHPTFLASLGHFRAIRFMDWGMTNATSIVNWADRTQPTARTWYASAGVPIEKMFELAGKLGADSWMNIPPYASDDYVHSFAQLAHAQLPPNTKLDLEYGNEMWNYSFAATKWAAQQSQVMFASQLAGGANPGVLEFNWYAQRLAQVCKIVKTEFGADASKVVCVANTQAANSWATDQTLKCQYAAPALGQPCAKFVDAVAIAPYFGSYIGNTQTASAVTSWTSDADGGLARMFLELNGVDSTGAAATPQLAALGSNAPTGAVAQVGSWMKATKTVLDTYGLPMWAYEGGQSLIPASGNTSMLNLMVAANRDARMGVAYQAMMADWKNAGGQTFMMFSDVGSYTKSGMWGLRENQFDVTTPKWIAATSWRDRACWWTGC